MRTQKSEGTKIRVKVVPRSKENGVTAMPDGTYVVRTTATPTDGKANAAVAALLAAHVRVAKSRVSLVRGHASRHKVFVVHE